LRQSYNPHTEVDRQFRPQVAHSITHLLTPETSAALPETGPRPTPPPDA